MKQSANALSASIDALFAPTQAFAAVKENKGWSWVPFIIVIVSTVAAFLYYFSAVDMPWLQNQMLEQTLAASPGLTDDEIEAVKQAQGEGMIKWGSIIGAPIGFIVMNLVMAVYYNIASKIATKSDVGFTQWYGFTWWVSMPAVVSMLVAMLVVMFAPDGMISMNDLKPTTINSLILGLEMTDKWYGFAEGFELLAFWSIFVATFGLKNWLNIETKQAAIIAALPSVLIFGGWAAYVAMS